MFRTHAHVATRFFRARSKRYFSTPRPASENPSVSNATYTRLLKRTPKFLRPTVAALHNAPVTHITAFLLLHEVTAIIPLFGLAGAFHHYHWLPTYFTEGAWVVDGMEKFGRYFRRKGWIEAGEEADAVWKVKDGEDLRQVETTRELKWWSRGEGGMRWVVEFATAYAVVKALLPLRIVISVWGAPWFARWTITPISNSLKRLFSWKAANGRRMKPAVATETVSSRKRGGP